MGEAGVPDVGSARLPNRRLPGSQECFDDGYGYCFERSIRAIGAVVAGAIVMGARAISPEVGTIATVLGMTLIYAGYLIGFVFIAMRLANLFWTSLALDGHRFESNLQARDLAWIYFSNTLAIIVSLGLLIPWAVVRAGRYRASRLAFLASGSLDVFVAEAGAEQSATGAEIGDAFDFEFDAGL